MSSPSSFSFVAAQKATATLQRNAEGDGNKPFTIVQKATIINLLLQRKRQRQCSCHRLLFVLFQCSAKGDDNNVTITFFFFFCCSVVKKVTTVKLPSFFFFVA
jgi:hypothetical protein